MNKDEHIFQNICTYNCYCACGIKTLAKDNKIVGIEGDVNHPFSKGKLCAKGYAFLKQVYHPERILYPMRKNRRTSRWERISWEQAIDLIAVKILEIKDKYNTMLPVFFDNQSGNLGVLQKSLGLFFDLLGPCSKLGTELCASAGKGAHYYTFGASCNSSPEDMANSRLIIIWGGNPAWTCCHQMRIIDEARQKGARVIVIDPVQTATAVNCDLYVRIKPGTDGALALGMAKHIVEKKLYDINFVNSYTKGWEEFKNYLQNNISLNWASKITGVEVRNIMNLAENYAAIKPASIWQGLGAQRCINGGQNYRIINTLAAITGNIGNSGAGVYYIDLQNSFRLDDILYSEYAGFQKKQHRFISAHSFLDRHSPPIKMAFITASNPLARYPSTDRLSKFFKELDLVITVDLFLTNTANYSDIFLPAATFFEKPDIVSSYWHQYIGYNQRAIHPLGECKSELEIAMLITKRLRKLSSTAPSFPTDLTDEQFLEKHFNPLIKELKNVHNFTQFKQGGYYTFKNKKNIAWSDKKFLTPSNKFEIVSERAEQVGLPLIPCYMPAGKPENIYPYRLLSVHSNFFTNSQFANIDILQKLGGKSRVLISKNLARKHLINQGDRIRVYNRQGELILNVEITETIPDDLLVCFLAEQTDGFTINKITTPLLNDMGDNTNEFLGIAYNDTFVNITKIRGV
nr:molybdopterin-dependent oxidoreductase [Desulforadius tongensis]